MKPFVAIGGVLDNLFFTTSDGISVDDCAKTENLYRPYEAVLRPSTRAGSQNRFVWPIQVLSFGTIVNGNAITRRKKKIVQHPADRDKRLHDPRLRSARSKQSARACCPTSVLSVAPSQTHSRDPQLPGTPLRSRDRRPRGARCCGHTNSREGVLRSRHARGWSARSCVLVLCSLVPW